MSEAPAGTSEGVKYPPLNVRYEGELTPENALFNIDGTLLAQAIQESGYSRFVVSNVVISNKADTGEIAHFNGYKNEVVLYQDEVIKSLRRHRQEEQDGLDAVSESPNRLKDFLYRVRYLLNPMEAPYQQLNNKGKYLHIYSGNRDRRNRYRDQAQEGFEFKKDGETVKLSREESVDHAKQLFDRLLERAAPGILGWVVAHEFEHKHHHGRKLSIRVGSLLVPGFGGFVVGSAVGTGLAIPAFAMGGALLGWVGSIVGIKADEEASFDAWDKNFAKFAKAISINHDVFRREVLGGVSKPAIAKG